MSRRAGHFPFRTVIVLCSLGFAFAGVAIIYSRIARAAGPSWLSLFLIVAMCVLFYFEYRAFRTAEPFMDGGLGERKVGLILADLEPDGYRVVHAISKEKGWGDIDHVVVGPSGIFAIETKAWRGRMSWEGKKLNVAGRDRTRKIKKAVSHATFVRKQLPESLRSVWVVAIVAFAEDVPRSGCRKLDHMWGVPAEDLVGFIRSHPRRLTTEQVDAAEHSLNRRAWRPR